MNARRQSRIKGLPKSKSASDARSGGKTGRLTQPLAFAAVSVSQTDHTLYLFKAKASVLYSALSINQRIQEKDEGYQRVLSVARVQAITRYVIQKKALPGAVIVSLDTRAHYNKATSELSVPKGTDVGWVIDGQHRLAGAAMAARGSGGPDIELPVVAFIGLGEKQQIEQFVTINREAKNVPTSLYLDLLRHLPNKKPGDVAKERAADLGTQLRRDEESPFYQRIAVTKSPQSGQVSLVNFVRKIAPHVAPDKGILNAYTEREQIAVVANFFEGLRQVFPQEFDAKESMFFKTVGFGGLWNAFPTFFSLALKLHHGFEVKDVVAMLQLVHSIDFKSWREYGSGNQAELNAGDDFKASLLLAVKSEDASSGALRV